MPNGHVFVIRGDVTKLACDAWLLPTDAGFVVEPIWDGTYDEAALTEVNENEWPVDKRVIQLTARTADRPAVWLGNIGAWNETAQWYADGAAAFVREAARALADKPRGGRPPLLAIHHVGTGRGGAEWTKGDVLRALFATLRNVLVEEAIDADVAVVSWGAAGHAAAQRARLHTMAGDGVTDDPLTHVVRRWPFRETQRADALRSTAAEIASHAQEGRLAVFMGAGVSAGAGLPGWLGLLAALGMEIAPPTTLHELRQLSDPRDQAALLERRFEAAGKPLAEAIGDHARGSRYSLLHGLLSSLPATEFITTNFDELFEAAATTSGRTLRVIGADTAVSDAEADRWLLKLHGTISDPSSIVLTRSSYFEAPRHRGALFGLVQAMLMTRHMLFVGYGLADEDFHELVHEVRIARTPAPVAAPESPTVEESKQQLGTAITLFDDPIHAEIWSGDVRVVAMCPRPETDQRDDAGVGREVELFLDLVGLLAADRAAFVLDDQYAGMLDDSEQSLKDTLSGIEPPAGADKHEGWQALQALLDRLGRTGPNGA